MCVCIYGPKTKSVFYCCRFESFIIGLSGALVVASVVDHLNHGGSPLNINFIGLTKL